MNSTSTEHPPKRVDTAAPPGAPHRRSADRRRAERRTLVLGLAVSLLLHLLVFVVAQHITGVGPPPAPAPRSTPAADPRPEGMEIVQLTERPDAPQLEEPPAEAPVEPGRRAPSPQAPEPPPEETEAVGEPEDAEALSPAERLKPRMYDRRLWAMPEDIEAPEPTKEERMRRRVYGRIRALNDSILAEMEADRRATDWTFTDKDGKRWGISPDGIHLGDITLPAPVFAPSERARDYIREWAEINDQADRARAWEHFEERVKAIRARKEKERKEKSGSGSSGSTGSDGG